MQSPTPHPELHGWQRFTGRWTTQATHPLLPGTVVHGHATFEWLTGRQFLIQRWHYDHPEIPDAIAIMGVTDGQLSMHYFDYRGVHRVYAASLDEGQWRFWRDAPGFSQRFTGILSDDGTTITGQGQLSRASRPQRDGPAGDRRQPLHDAGDDRPRRPAAAVAGVLHPRPVLGLLLGLLARGAALAQPGRTPRGRDRDLRGPIQHSVS